jgi:hypothetical protein
LQVCNHPDLFEGRPIVSAFDDVGVQLQLPTAAVRALDRDLWKHVNLGSLHLTLTGHETMARWEADSTKVFFLATCSASSLPAGFFFFFFPDEP